MILLLQSSGEGGGEGSVCLHMKYAQLEACMDTWEEECRHLEDWKDLE